MRLLDQIVHITLDAIDIHGVQDCLNRFRFGDPVELSIAVHAGQLKE